MSDGLDIPVGTSASEQMTVTHDVTVAHRIPGMPEVFSTPMMIYLMEIASAKAIQALIPAGWVSVGTEVNIRHLAATPIGFVVTATSEVTAVDGRLVTFRVQAHDGAELIGEGTHVRAAVDAQRFVQRVTAKRPK